jgi:hypothetical protein
MSGPTTILASVTTVGLIAALPASAPTVTKYRIETRVEQTVDLTALGQGEQKSVITQMAVITVTLTDSARGKVMHVVVDSLAVDSPVGAPAAELAAAKGAWFHGFLDGTGRTAAVVSSNDSSDVLGQLRATLRTFHPRLKPGFKQGDTWSDTTDVESKTSSQATKGRVVTNYTADGEEVVGGVKAWRLATAFSSAATGTMQNPMAGAMDLESSETGTGVYYVAADGRFLGGTTTGTGNAKVSSAMLPEAIPVKSNRVSTVTVVP